MRTNRIFLIVITVLLVGGVAVQAAGKKEKKGKKQAPTATGNECDCAIGYPYASANPRTSIVFNESEVLRGFSPKCVTTNDVISLWYSDEHALTLGVDTLIMTTATGIVTTNTWPVTTMPSPNQPHFTKNVLVGLTSTNLINGGTDLAGRPMWPAMFLTDITDNPTSRAGDWQNGGVGYKPTAVYGTWKAATKIVDYTKLEKDGNPYREIKPAVNPSENNAWALGPQADLPPTGLAYQEFAAQVTWDVRELIKNGILLPDHSYRLQFMVHDGDQNKTGGDVGQACVYLKVFPLTQ